MRGTARYKQRLEVALLTVQVNGIRRCMQWLYVRLNQGRESMTQDEWAALVQQYEQATRQLRDLAPRLQALTAAHRGASGLRVAALGRAASTGPSPAPAPASFFFHGASVRANDATTSPAVEVVVAAPQRGSRVLSAALGGSATTVKAGCNTGADALVTGDRHKSSSPLSRVRNRVLGCTDARDAATGDSSGSASSSGSNSDGPATTQSLLRRAAAGASASHAL